MKLAEANISCVFHETLVSFHIYIRSRCCEGFIPVGTLHSGERSPNSNGGISEAYHTMSVSGMTLSSPYLQQRHKVTERDRCNVFISIIAQNPRKYGNGCSAESFRYQIGSRIVWSWAGFNVKNLIKETNLQGDYKLLLGFLFVGHGKPDSNLESP
jgi:hypothetical protein